MIKVLRLMLSLSLGEGYLRLYLGHTFLVYSCILGISVIAYRVCIRCHLEIIGLLGVILKKKIGMRKFDE
jgi:hypothetical protein